jgi:hypothetical protein
MRAWRYGQLTAAGASREHIRNRVTNRDLDHPHHNVYTPPLDGPIDRVRALFAALPDHCVAGYHTAAFLHGFGVIASETPHIVVPAGTPVPDLRGVKAHPAVLPYEPVMFGGVPCLPAARCAIDLARSLRRSDALSVLDAALASAVVDADGLYIEVMRHDRLRGVRQARELVPLADPGAECRQAASYDS